MVCLQEGQTLPSEVEWKGNAPAKDSRMILLQTGKTVKWKKEGEIIKVFLPGGLPADLPALAFEYNSVY